MHTRFILLGLLIFPATALALEPDQIALIVNSNSPKGVELAEHYAKARGLPDGRIITLTLPQADDITPEVYARDVAEPVRQFLKKHQLEDQVKCLVTFYGIPIRVSARVNTPQEAAELSEVVGALKRVEGMTGSAVGDLEQFARRLDPAFRPLAGNALAQLARRTDAATKSVAMAVQQLASEAERQSATNEMIGLTKRFSAPVADRVIGTPATKPDAATGSGDLDQLAARIEDPEARRTLRELGRQSGLFAYAQMLSLQVVFLQTENTDAAVDSELAAVWWPIYPRAGWQPNPLSERADPANARPRLMMISRLDGPDPDLVRRLIDSSLEIERTGLRGRVVIDSRGLGPHEPGGNAGFGVFDQFLRDLARFLRTRTKLNVLLDEAPDVLPPDAADNVALYCGWYSVSKYVPGMKFNPGAVGVHIASFTMSTLHNRYDGDWVRGLLLDGCVATYGAVSEPLLHAFPRPDDFFPLLLTGKLTLAEVYWRTTPLVSWKLSLIGDPLYTPYKANPALRVEDLTPLLRHAFSDRQPKQ